MLIFFNKGEKLFIHNTFRTYKLFEELKTRYEKHKFCDKNQCNRLYKNY